MLIYAALVGDVLVSLVGVCLPVGRSMLTKQTTVTQARQTILESEEDEDESSVRNSLTGGEFLISQ